MVFFASKKMGAFARDHSVRREKKKRRKKKEKEEIGAEAGSHATIKEEERVFFSLVLVFLL